jgi:hypothetical protein
MMDVIRSLPQGLFWYPLLLLLLVVMVRTVWLVTHRRSYRVKSGATGADLLKSLELLVSKANSDWYSRQDLERRCIGLLLQLNGYAGYSIDNCRSYLSAAANTEASLAIGEHLSESEQGQRQKHLSGDGDSRVAAVLSEIERITEAPGG